MPPSAPALVLSREVVIGTAVPASDLPRRKYRRIFDMGASLTVGTQKRTDENLDYFIDMRRFLEPGDTIVGCRATTSAPYDLFITRLEYAPTGVVVWLGGGHDAGRYLVEVAATTEDGRQKVFNFQLITRGDDIPLVYPLAIHFPTTLLGWSSTTRNVRIINNSSDRLRIFDIMVQGDFVVDEHNCGDWLAPGEECVAKVFFWPKDNGVRRGALIVNSSHGMKEAFLDGTGQPEIVLPVISISDGVLGAATAMVVSISDGVLGAIADTPSIVWAPTSFAFADTEVGGMSAPQTLTITNSGTANLIFLAVNITGDFSYTTDFGSFLTPGSVGHIYIRFAPTAIGAETGTIGISTNAANEPGVSVALSGEGVAIAALQRIFIQDGNQFATVAGYKRLNSINLYGFENTNKLADPNWVRPAGDVLDQIKAWGFNCIRLPFSPAILSGSPPVGAFDEEINPQFVGLTALECLDWYIGACAARGIYVVLDHHRRTAGSGADGSPVDGSYTITDFTTTWETLATRYGEDVTVIGADLHNEPHSISWSTWKGYVETVGDAIHAIAPNWLIFVEGAGETAGYWWGENLSEWVTDPIALTLPNKLVASPHEYGQSVATGQSWLSYGSGDPVGWPGNLYARRTAAYGFIFEGALAPVWVGEIGGKFGYDNDGAFNQPYSTQETAWFDTFVTHANGDYNGDGNRNLSTDRYGMSWAYFAFNASSADTGGLVREETASVQDWETPIQPKVDLLAPLFAETITPAAPARTIQMWWDGWGQTDIPTHIVAAASGEERVGTTRFASIPSYCGYVCYAFAKPNMTYVDNSLDTLTNTALKTNTGLDWQDNLAMAGTTLREAGEVLKARNPNTKILLAVGGGIGITANTLWGYVPGGTSTGPNYTAICNFIKDLGWDGVVIDFETSDYSHYCSIVSGHVVCQTDTFIQDLVTGFRAQLPREDGFTVGICANGIGFYGEPGTDWATSLPVVTANAGAFINLMESTAADDLDMVQIMSYDTSTDYEPLEALAAAKHFCPAHVEIFVSARTRGYDASTDANNIFFTKAILETMAQAVIDEATAGLAIYAAFWPPHPQDQDGPFPEAPTTSDAAPSAIAMCQIIADYWEMPDASVPLWADIATETGSAVAPAGWSVSTPAGTSVWYTPENRGGEDGYLIEITGTTAGTGEIYIAFDEVAAVVTDDITCTYRAQVNVDDADITTLYAGCVERNSSNAYLTTTYHNWYATRLTNALRDASRVISNAATAKVSQEFLTNTIASGSTINFTVWIGDITLTNNG